MYNPVIAMLHNTKLERWHPILFYASPLPSGDDPMRHKSKGHHTQGFATRDEALENAKTEVTEYARRAFGEPRFCLAKDFPWDGEGVPASVVFFGEENGEVVPMF